MQNLSYVYDPAGNITHIQDDAQQTIYFKNVRVEPSADYTYDALYRLIEATGREHLGQAGGSPIPHSHNDATRVGVLSSGPGGTFQPNDGNAMGRYCESYVYDAVGNFKEMIHRRLCSDAPSWTRSYAYGEVSLIENEAGGGMVKNSNRLSSTTVGSTNPTTEQYHHDAHGNMVRMPHLGHGLSVPNLHWNYKDQLRQTDLGGGGVAFYVYDAGGQRVRKVWEKSPGLIEERIYLGGFEIFRRHGGAIRANSVTLERETLHVMDDQQRIALVETRTLDTARNDPAPRLMIRYQFGNHLGSSSLELDERAQIISYEEYTPYGSTSYQAVRSATEISKRYRYTGKERDEESGLYYYGARYCACWLGRWVSCDPIGIFDSRNLFGFVRGNPIVMTDPNGLAIGLPQPAPSPVPFPFSLLPDPELYPTSPDLQSEPENDVTSEPSLDPTRDFNPVPDQPIDPTLGGAGASPAGTGAGALGAAAGGGLVAGTAPIAGEGTGLLAFFGALLGIGITFGVAGEDPAETPKELPGAPGVAQIDPQPNGSEVSDPAAPGPVEAPADGNVEPIIDPTEQVSMRLAQNRRRSANPGDTPKLQRLLAPDRRISRLIMLRDVRNLLLNKFISTAREEQIMAVLERAGLWEKLTALSDEEIMNDKILGYVLGVWVENHHELEAAGHPERASDPGIPLTPGQHRIVHNPTKVDDLNDINQHIPGSARGRI